MPVAVNAANTAVKTATIKTIPENYITTPSPTQYFLEF
jgi:hypothetical protein